MKNKKLIIIFGQQNKNLYKMRHKKIKYFLIIFLILAVCYCFSSCAVIVRKDSGKHKGWFKNPKNPHHPLHKPDVVKPPKHIHKGKGKGKQK